MSTVAEIQIDPFAPIAPDEEIELGALAASLQLANGFTLLMTRCNQADQRQRLINSLRQRLPQLHIQEINFQQPITHLLDELRSRIEIPAPDVIFISGLENSLPVAAKAANTPVVANLNAARNSFSRYIPCPLVLWVPEYVVTAILYGAPDFFSVLSGVYHFAVTPTETASVIDTLVTGSNWNIERLSIQDKIERIQTIQRLLEDYRVLPGDRRDHRAEATLQLRLAVLEYKQGRWREAELLLDSLLNSDDNLLDEQIRTDILLNLGHVYVAQGRLQEAEDTYAQSLELFRQSEDQARQAQALGSLGIVSQRRKNLDDAEELYKQALNIYKNLKNVRGEGAIISSLGTLHRLRGNFEGAEVFYKQSLLISREIGDLEGEATTLNDIGTLYRFQGRLLEAQVAHEQSLKIFRSVGDRVAEGKTLKDLALLRAAHADWAGALYFGREALAVLSATESQTTVASVRQLITTWEEQFNDLHSISGSSNNDMPFVVKSGV